MAPDYVFIYSYHLFVMQELALGRESSKMMVFLGVWICLWSAVLTAGERSGDREFVASPK